MNAHDIFYQEEIEGARVGFIIGGMVGFIVSCYMLEINPLSISTKEFWETNGIQGLLAIGVPSILLGILGVKIGAKIALKIVLENPNLDLGWSALEKGKLLWQDIPELVPASWYGRIDKYANKFQSHSKIFKAKCLLQMAIDNSTHSHYNPLQAKLNKATAIKELGLLQRAINEFDDARNSYLISLEIVNSLGGVSSGEKKIVSLYRTIMFCLGELDHVLGNHEEAESNYQNALQADELLGHDDPDGERFTKKLMENLKTIKHNI